MLSLMLENQLEENMENEMGRQSWQLGENIAQNDEALRTLAMIVLMSYSPVLDRDH